MLDDFHYHVLICHHNEGENLKILTCNNNSLDVITWEGYLSRKTSVLCETVAQQINANFDLVFLQAECEYCAMFHPSLLIFETYNDDTPDPPKNHKWVSQASSDDVNVDPPTEPVIRYLEEFKTWGLDVNGERLFPYSRGGWFEVASKWLRSTLTEHGHNIKNVTQFRNGIEGCILIAHSESGSIFYMKSLPPRTYNEHAFQLIRNRKLKSD